MNSFISLLGTLALLLLAGGGIGLADRRGFSLRWLLVAAALVACNDALLTRFYHLAPNLIPGAHWNWQGKILAIALTLLIAALPAFGWRRIGLTLKQARGSMIATLPVVLIYCSFFTLLALYFPDDPSGVEEVAFQLTMPGLEEEPFYRGILLFALDRAFTRRVRFLGVDWGWGALLSCALFGLAHGFGYADGHFSIDPIVMALTALPSLLAVWLRLRTRSLMMPILLHNFGNVISLLF
ncbi:CPBP family intramembrane metalloprotease [Sphingobium sp. BYY-5]|uniref:CPBP family intramembrane glutamic endopeptidase, BDIM_20840 family n=1 Tax=Sphingobium sp. BYY-5 TaxID=2926400 RepID=UPI001FA6B0D4|nr:CPBP family intramembrane glutamic endopeptidase [Sphingobium sp. BYY-5]MCI4589630.1 CPBP family intramembrane metalloprotease [Sphingobium sp. BYY-5]